jgi:hypothetical protein
MSDYQKVKEFISGRLKTGYTDNNILENSNIDYEIESIKKLLLTNASKYLFGDKMINLENDDFLRMKREFEKDFNVKMEEGILIQGDDQQLRDTTWWTGKVQQDSKNYYWNRYKQY